MPLVVAYMSFFLDGNCMTDLSHILTYMSQGLVDINDPTSELFGKAWEFIMHLVFTEDPTNFENYENDDHGLNPERPDPMTAPQDRVRALPFFFVGSGRFFFGRCSCEFFTRRPAATERTWASRKTTSLGK